MPPCQYPFWLSLSQLRSFPVQLLWFEGKPVVICRPQNQCTGHLRYHGDSPIFITGLETDLLKVRKGLAEGDRDMMLKRLKVFVFSAKIKKIDMTVPACARCFAEFLLKPQEAAGSRESAKRPAEGPTGSSPQPKRPASWSVEDVMAWLETLSLGHIAERFRDNGVDGEFLAELSEEDLVTELGLTKLQAKKIKARFPSE